MNTLAQSPIASKAMPHAGHARLSWRRFLAWCLSILGIGIGAYFLIIWPWSSRWGATDEELQKTLVGDELIENPALVTTKAISVQASPQEIWPWLVQLGVDRGGMYSYLWVENWLMRLNVENSDEIRPEWQTLKDGDFIRFTPKDFALNPGPGLYVMAIEPHQALVGCFGMEATPVDCNHSATWQFVLEPQADNTTRLLLRSRSAGPPSLSRTIGGQLAYPFSFYMERKMLLGIKLRAERLSAFSKRENSQ